MLKEFEMDGINIKKIPQIKKLGLWLQSQERLTSKNLSLKITVNLWNTFRGVSHPSDVVRPAETVDT